MRSRGIYGFRKRELRWGRVSIERRQRRWLVDMEEGGGKGAFGCDILV